MSYRRHDQAEFETSTSTRSSLAGLALRWKRSATTLRIVSALAVLVAAGSTFAGTKLTRSARDPVFIDITMDSPADWLSPDSTRRGEIKSALTNQIREMAENKPGRVIALRIDDGRIRFERLSSSLRRQVEQLAGPDSVAKNWYERRLGRLLLDVMSNARKDRPPMMLSVYGLPEERCTDKTNESYEDVIADIEAFVVAKNFILSGSNSNQESMLRTAMPDTYRMSDGRPIFLRNNRDWKMTIGLEGALRGSSSSTAISSGHATAPPVTSVTDPIAQLQAAWGKQDAAWDVNIDGVTDLDDMLLLINHWEFYSQGGTGPPPGSSGNGNTGGSSGGNTGNVARFTNASSQYVIGSGDNLKLEMLPDAPANPHVVFQVWSDATNSIEAAVTDWEPPFKYTASSLNSVTPGGGEVQALVRDEQMHVVAIIRNASAFVLPDPPPSTPPPVPTTPPPSTPPTPLPPTPPATPPGGNGGSGGGGGEEQPTPIPMIRTLLASGMAPFTAHVHALFSTVGVGDALTARYEWNFGDENGQFNTLVGWNAAHLYDQPGTYTITLKVINQAGKSATATTQITVTSDSRTKIYVSEMGSDTNSGTSPNTPVRTIARVGQLMANNRTILFQRSGTYQLNSSLSIGNRSNVVLGAYGTGSKPKFYWTTNEQYPNMINLGDDAKNVVIQDLKFDSPFAPSNLMVRGIGVRGTNATVRNCTFGKVSYAMSSGGGGVKGWLTMGNDAGTLGAYYAWCEGSDQVHIGNTVGGGVDEHNIRMCADRILIAHNDLTNTSKSTIWANLGDYCYVANNKLRKGRFLVGPNFANSSHEQAFRWVVFDSNEMFDEGVILYSGAENIMLRNNVIHFNGGECFSIWGYHDTYDHNVKNVFVYNNTAFNSNPSYGRFSKLGKDAESVVFANNLYCATSLNTQNGAGNIVSDDDNLNTLKFVSNIWANPTNGSTVHGLSVGGQTSTQWAGYVQTTGEKYRNFHNGDLNDTFVPQFNANSGQAVPGVHLDFAGNPRPLTGAVTVGAVQKP